MAPKKKKGAKGKKKKKAAKGEGDEEKKEDEQFKIDLPHFGWVKITVSKTSQMGAISVRIVLQSVLRRSTIYLIHTLMYRLLICVFSSFS